jgi:uncharacterized protein
MDYIIICCAALLGSCLTFFSGFGLGTLLTPVFALFFPIELAIAMTAIVHLSNNVFKFGLVGHKMDKSVVLWFGTPSVLGAFLGAYVLKSMSSSMNSIPISVIGFEHETTILKIVIGIVLIVFALWEIIPKLSKMSFDAKYLPLGGLLSGFFGGLSGMQGALRSAFLLRTGLSKEEFIATGIFIACLVDVSRLSIYGQHFRQYAAQFNFSLIACAALSAFVGAYVGNIFLKKITLQAVQYSVATALIIFGCLIIIGFI